MCFNAFQLVQQHWQLGLPLSTGDSYVDSAPVANEARGILYVRSDCRIAKPISAGYHDQYSQTLTVLIIITCRNGFRNSAVATVVGSTSAEGSEDKMVSSWIRLAQTHQATWSRSMGVSRQLPTLIEDARVGWTKILHVKSLWPATKCIGLCLASFSRPWKPSTELTSTPWRPVRTPCFCSIRRRSFTCKASTLSGKLGCTESWMIVDDHK